jgi:STE24 endopeptidase
VISTTDPITARSNALAAAYQPRRQWAAIFSVAINLLGISVLVLTGGAERLYQILDSFGLHDFVTVFVYVTILFIAHAAVNFPIELWFGYLEERQFGLAKAGIRAWTRDWLAGTGGHGMMFIAGSCLFVSLQISLSDYWLPAIMGALLVLFLLTSYLGDEGIPKGLFHIEPADEGTINRMAVLAQQPLPYVLIFSSTSQRDYAGGLAGLFNRQRLLISRSTIHSASDNLLRFLLLHEIGHRRLQHVFLATLIGWLWIAGGFAICDGIAPSEVTGTPVFIAWLAMILTAWLAVTEPIVAWIGRRFEYAADRHFLRSGGTLEQMSDALCELSRRNLASTDAQSRRRTLFHPLPSVDARLRRAERFLNQRKAS